MRTEAERLAKSAISTASSLKDRVSNSLSKTLHAHLEASTSANDSTTSHDGTLSLMCAACRAGPFSYEGFRQAVAEGHYDDTTGYCYTRTWREISESIDKEACGWCRVVRRTRDGLPADKFPYGKDSVEVRLQIEASSVRKSMGIILDGYKAASYVIYAKKGDNAVQEIREERKMFPKESYVDYQKALECVEKCSHHEYCPPPEKKSLPTRVIDCSDPPKPRLLETNRQIHGHYCTLSYAWGGEQYQNTTTKNIDTYTNEGINVLLPQTITDAIVVTHKLGLRYLWVDALCIIQDSDADKVKELGTMGQIYRDAYLSLSILSAYRADEGFLFDERPPDILPYYLSEQPHAPGQMLLEYIIPRKTPGLGKYETVRSHMPLNERGWCFQEDALAPRKLIFQPPNVVYKCRSFTGLEISRPSRFQRYETPKTYPANDHLLFPLKGKQDDKGPANDELREQWRRSLLNYTERKITDPSDKLVALSSIVEVFQSMLNDQYIAGLWKSTLLYDLLWKIWPPMGPDETIRPRPQGYRAPTWSWASIDGKLDLPYSLSPPPSAASYEAEILACEVTPKVRELPLGQLVDGRLVLRAKIHPLMRDGRKCTFKEHRGERYGNQFVSTSTNWKWTPPLGNCLEPINLSIEGLSEKEQEEKRIAGIRFDSHEGTEQDRPMDFYVIILRAGRNYKNQGDWMHGLLLVRVEGEVVKYRRVAILDLQYHFEWPDWFDDAPLKTVTLI